MIDQDPGNTLKLSKIWVDWFSSHGIYTHPELYQDWSPLILLRAGNSPLALVINDDTGKIWFGSITRPGARILDWKELNMADPGVFDKIKALYDSCPPREAHG